MTSGVIGGAACQWPLGILSDRVDRRRVLAATAFGAVVVSAILVIAGTRSPDLILMLLGAAWGGMAFPIYSVAVALTNDHASEDEYVQVSSGLLLLYGMGAVVGPLLAPAVIAALGPVGLYVFSGGVHLLLFGYVGVRALEDLPVPSDQQSDFGDALASVQTASTVYERESENDAQAVSP